MNSKHTDASQRFRSLDDIYYFGGQEEHRVRAIWSNQAKSPRQLSFDVGDELGIAGKRNTLFLFITILFTLVNS